MIIMHVYNDEWGCGFAQTSEELVQLILDDLSNSELSSDEIDWKVHSFERRTYESYPFRIAAFEIDYYHVDVYDFPYCEYDLRSMIDSIDSIQSAVDLYRPVEEEEEEEED